MRMGEGKEGEKEEKNKIVMMAQTKKEKKKREDVKWAINGRESRRKIRKSKIRSRNTYVLSAFSYSVRASMRSPPLSAND